MALRLIQDSKSIFDCSSDVLCIGIDKVDLSFLNEVGAESLVVDLTSLDVVDFDVKFNFLIIGLKKNVFGVFGVVEKYLKYLLSNGYVLIRISIDCDVDDTKNVVAQMSKSLSLQPEEYFFIDDNEVWILLSRV